MNQQFKRFIARRFVIVIGMLPIALIALSNQSCTTPARDHYMNLTHSVVEVGAPEHDEVALAFGLPLYQPPFVPEIETESALVEVPTKSQP